MKDLELPPGLRHAVALAAWELLHDALLKCRAEAPPAKRPMWDDVISFHEGKKPAAPSSEGMS